MQATNKKLNLRHTNVVGTIHDASGFRDRSLALTDAVEVRADSLPRPPSPEEVGSIPKPVILTVRGIHEGGARDLPDAIRRDLYMELLPVSSAVDIEASSLREMHSVVALAKKLHRPVIASFHDFVGMPSRAKALGVEKRALAAGASCIKIAATVDDAASLARLMTLFVALKRPCAVMGMGGLGKVSRLALARCGSSLNYCWLGKPQVPGQWAAKEMAELMKRFT